jgi:hypothetical protein
MKIAFKATTLCALALITLAGCAGGAKGPSDEELVTGIIMDANAALLAQDIEKSTMMYSDDFTSEQGGKAEYIEFLNTAKDGGFLDDMEMKTDEMVVTVDGDTATAGPVVAIGTFGELVFHFEFEKRDGQWMVTKQTQQM